MSGRAVVVFVEEGADIEPEAWSKISNAVSAAMHPAAPLVQTILVERGDTERGAKVTLRPFSGVLQPEPPLRGMVHERDTKLP